MTSEPIRLTITLRGQTVETTHDPDNSILGDAIDAGLRPPYSCLAGACATCIAKVTQGSATMEANSVLTEKEVEQGYILTCQALPTAPHVALEYEG